MKNTENNMNIINLKKLVYLFIIAGLVFMACDTRNPTNTTNLPGAGDVNSLDVWVNSGYVVLDGINAIPKDTINAQVLDENGGPIKNVNVSFKMVNTDSYGSLSTTNVSTDSTGKAMSVYSIEPGEIPTEITLISTDIEISIPNAEKSETVNLEFEIHESWKYPELNVEGFGFYPNVESTVHVIGSEEEISVISKNGAGVGICNVPVFFKLESSTSTLSAGEINKSVSESCEDNSNGEEGGESGEPTSDSTSVAESGISSLKYTNINGHNNGDYDILIAMVKDPNTDEVLKSDTLKLYSINQEDLNLAEIQYIHVWSQSSELSIDDNEETYTDTLFAEALDGYGSRLGGVLFNFSIGADDIQWGSLASSSVLADSSGLAQTSFRTYPSIFNSFDDADHPVSITITIPGREDLTPQLISLNLMNNLPICSDCEAQLSLTTSPNTLPYGDPTIEQSIITAFMVDSLGNPPEEGTLIEFESITEDDEGEWIDFGHIEPYAYFDGNGEASVTFNMGNDAGLATIIGNSNGLSDTAYIVINSTNASYIEIIPSYPSEITVTGGGGQEATEAAVEIKDGNGNLVTDPYKLFFQIEAPMPEGVHLNGLDGVIQALQSSTVGQSAVTINAGTRPGSVKIHCTLFSDDVTEEEILAGNYSSEQLIATAEWEPVTIATGAPEFGEINFSPVDITPINGGMYELPISISLWDIHSNPVSDSTGVYVWIEENATPWDDTAEYFAINPDTGEPDIIKWGTTEFDSLAYVCLQDHNNADEIILPTNEEYWERMQQPGFADGTTKTGGLNASGDSYPGIAWSNIYYSSATTFSRIVIKAQTFTNGVDDTENQYLILDSRDNHDGEATVLPFQPGQIIVSASIQFWDFNPDVNGDTGGFTDPITIQAMITDYYGYPIDNGNLQLNAPGASFNGFIGADPDFENPSLSNAQGIVQWTIAYNKALCVAETNTPPITYADFISSISVQLLDPQQISSDPLDITLANSSIDE